MELNEITGLFDMDYGAPQPIVISSENDLIVAFYLDSGSIPDELIERNTILDSKIVIIKFNSFIKYTFGIPGNESIYHHPYSKLGLSSCGFYELTGSDLIEELEDIEKNHPYFNPDNWKMYNHYILTFHDTMFECVAKSFDCKQENVLLYQRASVIMNELWIRKT